MKHLNIQNPSVAYDRYVPSFFSQKDAYNIIILLTRTCYFKSLSMN